MFCTNCGKQISVDDRFCAYCGRPVSPNREGISQGKEKSEIDVHGDTSEQVVLTGTKAATDSTMLLNTEERENIIDGFNTQTENYVFHLGCFQLQYPLSLVKYQEIKKQFDNVEKRNLLFLEDLYKDSRQFDLLWKQIMSDEGIKRIFSLSMSMAHEIYVENNIYDMTPLKVMDTRNYRENGDERTPYIIWRSAFQKFGDKYHRICQEAQIEREKQQAQKEYDDYVRSLTESGASKFIKGATSSLSHSVKMSRIDSNEKEQLKELYEDKTLLETMKNTYLEAVSVIVKNIAFRLGYMWITPDAKENAEAIMHNIFQNQISPEHRKEALIHLLQLDPLSKNSYKLYLKYCPNENGVLDKIAELFGVLDLVNAIKGDLLHEYIDGYFEGNRKRLLLQIEEEFKGGDTSFFEDYILYNGFDYLSEDIQQIKQYSCHLWYKSGMNLAEALEKVDVQYKENREACEDPMGEVITEAKYMMSEQQCIVIPNGVKRIERYAFANSLQLEEIQLPESLEKIDFRVFYNCPSLKQLILPCGVQYDISAYTGAGIVVLSEDTTLVGDIETIKRSQTVFDVSTNSSAYDLFQTHLGLNHTTILTKEEIEKVVGETSKTKCRDELIYRYMDIRARRKYHGEADKEHPNILRLPQNGSEQGEGIIKIYRQIAPEIFSGSSLTYVDIPDQYHTIGAGAFRSSKVVSVGISDGMQIIGENAFLGCSNLRDVEIPSTVIRVQDGAFQDCPFLGIIQVYSKKCQIGEHVFDGSPVIVVCDMGSDWHRYCYQHKVPFWIRNQPNPYLGELQQRKDSFLRIRHKQIADEISAYNRDLFLSEWKKINKISNEQGIPRNSVFGTKHGEEERIYFTMEQAEKNGDGDPIQIIIAIQKNPEAPQFISRDGMRSITVYPWIMKKKVFHYSMISQETYVNANCLYIDGKDTIEYIDEGAFADSKVLAVRFNGIKEIWRQAFIGCQDLRLVLLGNQLTRIEDHAFADCPNLRSIYIPSSVIELGEGIFQNNQTVISCEEGSVIHEYCIKNGLKYYLLQQLAEEDTK